MEDKYTDSAGRDHVLCPLIDEYIEDITCLENRAVADREIIETVLPEKYKFKRNWRGLCVNCKWHNY